MANLLSSGFWGFLCSIKPTGKKDNKGRNEMKEHFLSGFSGYGWKLYKTVQNLFRLEIDEIVVRKNMVVYELLIQKIRAIIGSLGISQASGKIKAVEYDGDSYLITLEDEMSFVTHDFIRCQRRTNGEIKSYWVEISDVIDNSTLVIPESEFNGQIWSSDGMSYVKNDSTIHFRMDAPEIGDEIVQFGNSEDSTRQSAIYLHVDGSGEPSIDVMFGIKSKSFVGCVKIRLGGNIPGSNGLKGFYCENGMIKCSGTDGNVIYQFNPDGSFDLGKGKITYDPKTDKIIFGEDIVLTWNNFDQTAKDNLKGDKGKDANLLPWVEDMNKNVTQIGSDYIISPKMFSGAFKDSKPYTGVAFGKDVITIVENGNEIKKSGLFGMKNGEIIFSMDSNTGDVNTIGSVIAEAIKANGLNINDNFIVEIDGHVRMKGILTRPLNNIPTQLTSAWKGLFVYGEDNENDIYRNFVYVNMDFSISGNYIIKFPEANISMKYVGIVLPGEDQLQYEGVELSFYVNMENILPKGSTTCRPVIFSEQPIKYYYAIGQTSVTSGCVSNNNVFPSMNCILLNSNGRYKKGSYIIKFIGVNESGSLIWYISNLAEIVQLDIFREAYTYYNT